MKIKVLIRATNVLAMIDEDDFDKELHLRIEDDAKAKAKAKEKPKRESGEGSTVGAMSAEELTQGIGEAVSGGVREALKSFAKENGGKAASNRVAADASSTRDNGDEPVERYDGTTRSYARAARAIPGWEARYAKLSPEERAVRSPEGDVYTWRFMRAFAEKNASLLNELKAHELKRFGDLDQQDPFIRATMGTTTSAVGGALVPSPLANLIILKRDARERLFPRAMQLTTDAETLTVPNEATIGAVTGTLENVALTETDSTFDDIVLTKKKVGRLARTSKELLGSISGAYSLSTIIANQASRKIGVYMDDQGAQTGDAAGANHSGSIALAGISTVAAVTGSLTRAKILALILGLPTAWRDGTPLTMMGNSVLTGLIGNLVDSNGRPFYTPLGQTTVPFSDVGNAANVVEGVPFIELPFTLDFLYVGVLDEGFAVLNGGGMRVEMTDVGAGAFESDQVVWKFVERRDSAVVNTDAFRKSVGALTA